MRNKVLVIVGPTAVGKSALAVRLARRLARAKWGGVEGGEIISADSRQVYTGLDIGTGKITKGEMRGIPHHLLDVADPRKQFTVADFQKLAATAIEDIHSRGKLPIVVGGTGLYIDALLRGLVIPEVPPNPKLRKRLEKQSPEALFIQLSKLDPRRAKTIDRHNPRRLIRAIEIALLLGRVPVHSVILENNRMDARTLYVGLTLSTDELHRRIHRRLVDRIHGGMLAEAKLLHKRGLSWRRMEELGLEYRYLKRYLKKEISKSKMTEELQKEIWHYAKRQITWFKRNSEIKWFSPNETSKIVGAVHEFISV